MKSSFHIFASIVLVLLHGYRSLPTGAPICNIDLARIESGHSKSSDETLDYELSAINIDTNQYEISIISKAETLFKGLLIYVVGEDPNNHLGSFQLPNDSFKFQTDPCKSEGVKGSSESTITHANSNDKPLSETKLVWKSNSNEKGPFKVMAIVAKDRNPWRMVKEIFLNQTFVPPYQNTPSSCESCSTKSACTTTTDIKTHSKQEFKILKCTRIKKKY